jgi:hypothetical protein
MNVPNWKQRLTAELKRDKKKAAILGVLVVVAGVVGGRMLISRESPPKARASVKAEAVQAPRPAEPTAWPSLTAPPRAAAPQTRTERQRHLQQLQYDFHRDIFEPNLDFFVPADASANRTSPEAVADQDEEAQQHEAEVQVIRAQAKALMLQSTMLGAVPTAMINDRVLRVGDWVNGFEVVQIGSGECVLEKNGVRVRLEMKLQH